MSTTSYVQLPPDGVGKKVRHRPITDLRVTTVLATPARDIKLTGSLSGAYGYFTGVYSADDTVYYLRDVVGTFQANDVLKDISLVTYATVSSFSDPVYASALNIVDSDVPEYSLTVDKRGAALTSFPEGTPQFDGWGHMQMSQMLAVGEYYHFVQDLGSKYTQTITPCDANGKATSYANVQFKPQTSSVEYRVGIGATDYAGRTTNQYHPYKPGVSQLVYTSIVLGDAGVAGVVREWGYFDQFNGFGFRLDGATLKVFLRTDSAGGTAYGTGSDTEVSQPNWNVNTLNSAQSSDFVLDVTKSNLYWMDIQGTIGRIRLGVETPDGRRITCHEFRNLNNIVGASCRNLSLPMTWAIRNTAVPTGGTLGNTYWMRVGAGVVFTETADVKYSGVLVHVIADDPVVLTSATNYTPFLSFKAKNWVNGPSQAVDANLMLTPNPLIVGNSYTIETTGTVQWTYLGANSNVPGVKFICTGTNITGAGGAAHMNIPNSIIGIHETFDWANQGGNNLHVGIFVLPNEKWLNGYQWSESIVPGTMLYVDQTASTMAQYQYWSDSKATGVAGAVSGQLMTINTATGSVLKEMFIQQPPQYANGPFGTGATVGGTALADRTKIIKQYTAFGYPNASAAYSSGGAAGSNSVVLLTGLGIAPGQLISGTNISTGTFVESITTASPYTAVLSSVFTGQAAGTYNFFTPGGTGTYLVSQSQTVPVFSGYGAYYKFQPIESFIAPGGSSGRAALGDRIEKSFGLGPNWNAAEDGKGVFVFAAKILTSATNIVPPPQTLMYTKYWKEIR